ncbi:MAG: hypothetical protein HRU33_09340 [Rhodobacteraceae bacterium]|nr:hypothetical protein [Paracoccaceae bacterium]
MQVFGYIRFSYLGRSDVRMSRVPGATQEDYVQRLFDPLRMETRFHFFEKICLPSIKAQSDQDFTIFIMASQDMPEPYKTRLELSRAANPRLLQRCPEYFACLPPSNGRAVSGIDGQLGAFPHG